MELANATVLIAGLGVSGRNLASVLASRAGGVITVDERREDADLHSFDEVDWNRIDMVMSSPAFSPSTPFVREAERRGIPVYSEVEFAWMLRADNARTGKPAPWVGITGTNGKTSTTEMVSAMLTACSLNAPVAGNIAANDISRTLSHAALNPDNDVLCVELSSFQMHFTESVALECAAITNIADDHLDWHGGRERYAADKAKVFRGARRAIVYNAQDPVVSALAAQAPVAEGCRKVGFTLDAPREGELGVRDGWIEDRSGLVSGNGEPVRLSPVSRFTHLREPNGTVYPHLLADALAALALALGLGADAERCLEALESFSPGGHRIATVATAHVEGGDIRFVDDSKATNAHAAKASLSSFADKSVVWIAGGLAKGSRFEELVRDQAHTIKAAVIIGVDQQAMLEAFRTQAPDIPLTVIDPTDNDTVMDRAVEACGTYAQAGDVVLMAPACASMDQFVSYADRGDRFAEAARRWVRNNGVE